MRPDFPELPRAGVRKRICVMLNMKNAARAGRETWAMICIATLAMAVSGCGQGTTTPGAGGGKSLEDGRSVLEAMVARYQQAKSYSDAGVVRLRFQPENGDLVDDTADFSVAFSRPGRLRMHCYQGVAVYAEGQVRAYVSELEGQVLTGSYDAPLDIEQVYFDEVLTAVLTQGIAGPSPQIGLLLEEDPLGTMLEGANEPELLDDAEIDGLTCYRVRIPRSDGDLVAWVDRETQVLLRLDYPVQELQSALEQQGKVSKLTLAAEFRGARIDAEIDEMAFRFESPSDARLVKRFRLTPPPQPPSKLLGKKIGGFEFDALDGSKVDLAALEGKVVVLDFWASWCGPCLESLPNLQTVYERYKDDDRVAMLAVSIDEAGVADTKLEETFAKIGVKIPIARDNGSYVQREFEVRGIPNMFVLGPDGTVQDNEEGFHPDLATTLPGKIDRLLAGEELHAEAWSRYEQRKAEYEAATQGDEEEATELPKVVIAEKSAPSRLPLARLWLAEELRQPGNVLPYEADGATEFLINDGYRAVAILSAKGELLAEHDLPLPEGVVVSMFRTAVDGAGQRYFVGTASTQKQVYVFDADWKLVLSYPEDESAEVADVQIADLEGDGELELLVSYWGAAGVQRVDLQGNRVWSEKSMENVFRMAVVPVADGAAKILCTHQGGTLVELSAEGTAGEPQRVGSRFIRYVIAAGDGSLCGLTPTGLGLESVVGIGEGANESWSYALPPGVHEQPIEMLSDATWEGGVGSCWLVTAADGSIHVIDRAGVLVDRFNYGSAVTGIAAARIDGANVLVVSSATGVEALSVDGVVPQAAASGPKLIQ